MSSHSLFLKDRFTAAEIRRVLAEKWEIQAEPCPEDCTKLHICAQLGCFPGHTPEPWRPGYVIPKCPDFHSCQYGWVVETMPGREITVEDGTDGTDTMPEDMMKMAARNLGSRFLPAKPKTRLVVIFIDATNDPERRAVFAVGWAFAKHTRAVMEDHTGRQTVFPAGGWQG